LFLSAQSTQIDVQCQSLSIVFVRAVNTNWRPVPVPFYCFCPCSQHKLTSSAMQSLSIVFRVFTSI
jgi:hypothetical protein